MASVEGFSPGFDGTRLLTRTWPTRGASWAHVLLVHGLGEHSGRYERVGDLLTEAGLAVHAYDHRGNGGSDGRRGHVEHWTDLLGDLGHRLAAVQAAGGGRPVVLYGHSLGGLLCAAHGLDGRTPRPAAVVLSSPGLDSTLPRWKLRLAAALAPLLPTLAIVNGVDPATLSRDPAVGVALAADRRCATASTLRFGAEAMRAQARVRAAAARGLGVPTLVLHGLDDGLVPAASSQVFAGAPQVERRTYPGLRHELHNEPEGAAIVGEIVDWLAAQLRPVTSTP